MIGVIMEELQISRSVALHCTTCIIACILLVVLVLRLLVMFRCQV